MSMAKFIKFASTKKAAISVMLIIAALIGYGIHLFLVADNVREGISMMRAIGIGIDQYSQDNDEYLPSFSSRAQLQRQLAPYGDEISLNVPNLLTRPGTNIPYLLNPGMSGQKFNSFRDSDNIVLLYQAVPTNNQRIVAILYHPRATDATNLMLPPWIRPCLVSERQWQKLTSNSKKLTLNAAEREQLLQ